MNQWDGIFRLFQNSEILTPSRGILKISEGFFRNISVPFDSFPGYFETWSMEM